MIFYTTWVFRAPLSILIGLSVNVRMLCELLLSNEAKLVLIHQQAFLPKC